MKRVLTATFVGLLTFATVGATVIITSDNADAAAVKPARRI